ncbi:MAG: hypothetical protein RBS81_15345 [Tenuifilaceae bacterium]|jgi:hypothetical protein|nr:hypothetical protein [Tenuifilaceae bacterium]
MKFFSLLLATVISGTIYAQQQNVLVSKADSLQRIKQYGDACITYQQALQHEKRDASVYYNAACACSLGNDTTSALSLLREAANAGYNNTKWMSKDSDLKGLRETSQWNNILELVQANQDEYEKNFDKPLKEKLEKIYVKDQTLRLLYNEALEKFGRGSEELDFFWETIAKQDSINEKEVIEIIETRGWVGISLVGKKGNTALWLIIQHAPVEIEEKYLPLLRESVLKGESMGHHLAMLEDRINMYKGLPQVYGSQITTDTETGKYVLYKLIDPEYVNQRRKEIGLGPIEEYVKKWNIEFNIEQKVK